MTRKGRLMGMYSLRGLVLFFTVAVTMVVPCHAESEWPQTEVAPPMIDPSQSDFLAEMQQQSVESAPPTAPPVEVPAVVETPVEVPSPVEAPPQIPDETPVPVEPQAEVPAEAPATEETSAPSWPVPEEIPQAQEMPQ